MQLHCVSRWNVYILTITEFGIFFSSRQINYASVLSHLYIYVCVCGGGSTLCTTTRKEAGSIPSWVTEIDSASNKNEYQVYLLKGKGGRCLGMKTLLSSCADCFEFLEASTSWNPQGLSRTVQGLLYLYIYIYRFA